MNSLILLQLSGLVAAACFFAAGYLSGKRRRATRADTGSRLSSEHEPKSFEVIVRRVAEQDGVKCVAIADEQSLTIAGVGDYQESLAVLGGALLESASKIEPLMPLGRVSRIILETDAGTSVGSFPLNMGGVVGVLATLTDGPPPASGDLSRVLEEASRIKREVRA